MKRIIFLLPVILFSCTVNETCREKTFGDDVWIQDGGTFSTGNVQFQEPDSLTFLSNGTKRRVEFQSGCDIMNMTLVGYDYWTVTQSDDNHIKMSASDSVFTTYHK